MEDESQTTILLVNDNPDYLELVSILLHKVGYRVITARDGREGFKIAQREMPHLVLSDVSMPRASGIELCQLIRADEKLRTTPVLLISALYKDTDTVVKALQTGADDYIEVPFEPHLLVAKVARLLERKKGESVLERCVAERTQQLTTANQQLKDEIAERKQIEETLRESENKYRTLIEQAAEGIFICDTQGKLLEVNSRCCEIFGYTCEEFAEHNVTEFIPAEDLDTNPVRLPELRVMRVVKNERRVRHKDGTLVPVEISARMLEDGRTQAIIRDLTERQQAAEALRQTEEQLRQVQKLESIGQLAGGIAHDFNNLLTAILGHSQLLLRKLEDGPSRQKVEEIKKAGDRAAVLTYQLLAFSRKQILKPEVLDLNTTVSEMNKILERLIEENVQIVTNLTPCAGLVKVDPGQLSQVILNLVVNARDAMPQGGRITIETANVNLDQEFADRYVSLRPGPHVMLAVSDTGSGMDAETQKQIFEPFFTTKEIGKGTGLGLATVYGIVKQSGGSIWVDSEIGKGTTFKVYLPRVEDEVTEIAEPNDVATELPRGAETILLVEDDEAVRTLAREMLEGCGYRVLEATDVTDAVAICEQHHCAIALLVTDIVMPKMSGIELSEKLAELCPQMRVLYMSGYTNNGAVRRAVLYDGTNFIQKPFSLESLTRKVRDLMDGAHVQAT